MWHNFNAGKRVSRGIIATILTLSVLQVVLLGFNSSGNNAAPGYGAAAVATSQPTSTLARSLKLPTTKIEAANYGKQYASPYQFEMPEMLKTAARQTSSQPNSGDLPTPTAAQSWQTPAPGLAANSFGNNGEINPAAYTPTNPANACGNVPAIDPYENDDTSAGAKNILPNIRQSHTLTSVSSFDPPIAPDGDIDWVRFQITDLTQAYTVETLNLSPILVDTIIKLFRGTATNPGTLVAASDDISISNLGSRIIYTPVAGDEATSVFFYVQIYAAPNRSCFGKYDISVSVAPKATPTPTTLAPTNTPTICGDEYEYDDIPENAKELKPSFSNDVNNKVTPRAPTTDPANNSLQVHFLCPTGDQDWVYFDLVRGKPYTIFTNQVKGGLDTLLILFEPDGNGGLKTIFSSDDYPGMGVASRIDFIVPNLPKTQTGEFKRYYAMVKDVSYRGFNFGSYVFGLTTTGNPKYTCFDDYEGDGLPGDAREILLNQAQTHNICPDGDADWVKFYAKANLSYTLRTIHSDAPGMDTKIEVFSIVFDTVNPKKVVSQRTLALNDDVGGSDLSSLVGFFVPVAGTYYAQVKNNGNIGRPGMFYTLRFNLADAPVALPSATPANQATPTLQFTPTSTPIITQVSGAPTIVPTLPALVNNNSNLILPAMKFALSAFQRLWLFNDLAVAQNQARRSWEWGPRPGAELKEFYADAPDQLRQVQYFDKSRMELNDPAADPTSPWFVTNGLLARELVTGQLAKGNTELEQRAAATLPIAGDLTAENLAPSYARFATLITNGTSNRATDLTGYKAQQNISPDGSVGKLDVLPDSQNLALYIPETGHNIPQVFVEYMQATGIVYDNTYKQGLLRNWVFSMGYPISEPYWIKAKVGGAEKDVLVQIFERRVLTYTPANTPEWRVEMANVGQHYYLWRYGKDLYSN